MPNAEIEAELFSDVPPGIVNWFNQRSFNNGIVINGMRNYNPDASTKNIDNELTLEPDWSKAVSYRKGDSTIAEVPVKMKGRIAFSTISMDPKLFDFEKSSSFTSFLFIQTPKKTRGVYMTIMADEGYLKGDRKKLHKNQFRKKEKDFSGLVLYHTMKGLFLNGYRYQNGYVVGKISTGKVANVKVKSLRGNSIKVEAPPCETWMITTYWEQCTDYYTEGG